MRNEIVQRLQQRMAAYSELAKQIDADVLQQTLSVPKHKTLAEHLWCVVGARESYATALQQGAWQGFACSIQAMEVEEFRVKLQASAAQLDAVLNAISEWTPEHDQLLAALAEHEVMHEGQIIRHMYAINQTLPDSWTWA